MNKQVKLNDWQKYEVVDKFGQNYTGKRNIKIVGVSSKLWELYTQDDESGHPLLQKTIGNYTYTLLIKIIFKITLGNYLIFFVKPDGWWVEHTGNEYDPNEEVLDKLFGYKIRCINLVPKVIRYAPLIKIKLQSDKAYLDSVNKMFDNVKCDILDISESKVNITSQMFGYVKMCNALVISYDQLYYRYAKKDISLKFFIHRRKIIAETDELMNRLTKLGLEVQKVIKYESLSKYMSKISMLGEDVEIIYVR